MANNNDLNKLPYAAWLEESLHDIVKLPVKSMAINVVLESGEVYTNYYQTSMLDKITIAGIIQQDAMLDTMAANGLVKYLEDREATDDEKE